jgi:hypothetical protein
MNSQTIFRTLAAAAALSLVLASPALGSMQVGEINIPTEYAQCNGSAVVQTAVPANARTYTVPANGVITIWQSGTGQYSGWVKLDVFRQTGPSEYMLVGSDGPRAAPSHSYPLYTGVRVPVRAGDMLGLVGYGTNCQTYFAGSAYHSAAFASDPALGSTVKPSMSGSAWALEVTAWIEPDADADGFGDETQDECPANPAAQTAPCPPPPAPAPTTTATPAPGPLTLSLSGRAKQRALKRGAVVEVAQTDRAATVKATGALLVAGSNKRLRLRPVTATTSAGTAARLELQIPAAAKRKVRAALRRGKRVSARLRVSATAGDSDSTATQSIAIRGATK